MIDYSMLLFPVNQNRRSEWGILLVLALTCFIGCMFGPVIAYDPPFPNINMMVMTDFGGTALIFALMSGIVLYETRHIACEGKTNYIPAAIT